MKSEGRARLRDGRALGYAEFGAPAGKPLFYFHGFPGSRLEAELAHGAALKLDLRLIAVDRPGYGTSDFKPDRTILDWPDDLVELADLFGFDRFIVVGASGGGPYAAACALKIPERLGAVGIVCGLGPVDLPGIADGMFRRNRIGLRLCRKAPRLGTLIFVLGARLMRRYPRWFVSRMAKRLPEPDRSVLRRPDIELIFVNTIREAFRSHPRGPARDLALFTAPWDFDLERITVPVDLWQGDRDAVVPPAMAKHQAGKIPCSTLSCLPGEGHFSLIVDHATEILDVLRSRSK